jgi:hypothetical protein
VTLAAERGAQISLVENVPIANEEQRPILVGEHGGARFARGGLQETEPEHDLVGAICIIGGAVRAARLERSKHRSQILSGITGRGQLA